MGDAIGAPQDHIDFAYKNGADSLALTDHGNMNGFSWQYLHAKKLRDKGVPFKPIFGVEAYFVPSLADWQALKLKTEQEKLQERKKKEEEKARLEREKLARKRKKAGEEGEAEAEAQLAFGDELAAAQQELAVVVAENGEDNGTIVENEEETKGGRIINPLAQRSHLVLLAKNNAGLKSLFRLVSRSYMEGMYRYPRMDFAMLRQEAKGNIIASSACISADAKLITSYGTKTLVEVVNLVKSGEEIYVLGYDETKEKITFGAVKWGEKTRTGAKTVTITLANGKKIRCTEDHKFYTKDGWKTVAELRKSSSPILTLK